MKTLGIRIDNIKQKQVLDKIVVFFNSNKQHKIFTPNPEMLVDAQSDKYFKEVLNSSDLNVCDGKGIQLFNKEKINRITGTDLMIKMCALAAENNKSIYLLGSTKKIVEKTNEVLKRNFLKLKIAGYNSDLKLTIQNTKLILDKESNTKIINNINRTRPDVLFVAFGHNKQEKWIHENLSKLPSVKIAIGVGGAFDYISGTVKRSPKWMRKIGLEWLYRLIKQPSRIKRIFKATYIFLYYVIKKNNSTHK
jgi:N-acetylglucosaminyldiphosphoundecaprenol N-acetyl-beta-D-mannosaminyltransferase